MNRAMGWWEQHNEHNALKEVQYSTVEDEVVNKSHRNPDGTWYPLKEMKTLDLKFIYYYLFF